MRPEIFVHAMRNIRRWSLISSGVTLADKITILYHLISKTAYLLTVAFGFGNRFVRWTLPVRNLRIRLNGIEYSCRKGTDDFLILTSVYEKEAMRIASSLEGGTFVDVGAHVGKYTLAVASNPTNRVVALEPDKESYRALEKNIRLNGFKNVVAVNCAAWSKDGRIKFYSVSDLTGGSSPIYHSNYRMDSTNTETVQGLKVDTLLQGSGFKKVDLVKIDVEGTESEALKGMTRTMMRDKPTILFESGGKPVSLARMLGKFGYRVRKVSEMMYLATIRSSRT